MDPVVQQLAVQLGALGAKNTAAAIVDRITAVKARKKDAETITTMQEIINDLIADKAEVTAIAQSFQEVLVSQRITETEIRYIADTVLPLVRSLVGVGEDDDGGEDSEVSGEGSDVDRATRQKLEMVEKLLSVETVTVLQLLGFNFKRAIGEPLTDLVGRLIASARPESGDVEAEIRVATIQNQTALFELSRETRRLFSASVNSRDRPSPEGRCP